VRSPVRRAVARSKRGHLKHPEDSGREEEDAHRYGVWLSAYARIAMWDQIWDSHVLKGVDGHDPERKGRSGHRSHPMYIEGKQLACLARTELLGATIRGTSPTVTLFIGSAARVQRLFD
jgi:hypothetical protein